MSGLAGVESHEMRRVKSRWNRAVRWLSKLTPPPAALSLAIGGVCCRCTDWPETGQNWPVAMFKRHSHVGKLGQQQKRSSRSIGGGGGNNSSDNNSNSSSSSKSSCVTLCRLTTTKRVGRRRRRRRRRKSIKTSVGVFLLN